MSSESSNSSNNALSDGKCKPHEFPVQEYIALRAEILKQIEVENQLITASLTAFAAIAGLALTKNGNFGSLPSLLVFLYPILALPLASKWRYSSMRMVQIGKYIRDTIEPEVGWQKYLISIEPRHRSLLNIFATEGTFIITAGLAIIEGLILLGGFSLSWTWWSNLKSEEKLLLGGAVLSVMTMAVIFLSTMVWEVYRLPRSSARKSGNIIQLVASRTRFHRGKSSEAKCGE